VLVRIRTNPSLGALAEVLLLFTPAIPAYLWLWPAVSGTRWLTPVQIAVYLYFLVGSLVIGLRRWSLSQLGLNGQGIFLSLGCGLAFVLGRTLVLLGTSLWAGFRPMGLLRLAGDVLYYFVAVGLAEELLFRGVIYHALDTLKGPRLALWGSALAFGFYHVGVGGVLGFIGGLLSGVILGAIRLRGGGIVGPVLVHGLIDVTAIEMAPAVTTWDFSHVAFPHPLLIVVGYSVIIGLLVFLWKLAPASHRAASA
jgi:membrane protease YdiL (CAAX protease family)